MKINLQQSLHNQEFQPLLMRKDNQGSGTTTTMPVTLGYIAINSLLADEPEKPSSDVRLQRYDLAQRINSAGNNIELVEQDIALLLDCVTRLQPTYIFAQVFKFLSAA